MPTITHDGYLATVERIADVGLFHGEIINARAVLTFQGLTMDEAKTAFADTVADYLDWCRERGRIPSDDVSEPNQAGNSDRN